ncbi:MAG: AIR synthase related protein, partial [Mycobacterium sp.]
MPDASDPSLQDLGEFAVIDRLTAGRPPTPGVLVGPGDDAAVLAAPGGRVAVSTDMLIEGRHFRMDWSRPRDVGRKSIAQNAADIESMGAAVTGFVVALGAPSDTPVALVTELSEGMWAEAAKVGAGIVGGDLVASPNWVVSVTALGDLGGREPVLRSG